MAKQVRKIISLSLTIVFTVLMVTGTVGCGQTAATDNNATTAAAAQTTQAATEPAKPEAKPVELAYWEQDDPGTVDPVWDEVAKDLTAKYPNITVKRTHYETEALRSNFQNAVAAGEGPQVISGPDDNIGVFGTSKTVMALDGLFPADFMGSINQKAIEGAKLDGVLYGMPYRIGNCLALLYNKKILPQAPQTMDELISKAKELTKGGSYGLVYNMTEPFFFIPFLGGYNGRVFDDKGNITLDTEAMTKALQFAYDLKFKEKIIPAEANYDVASNLFKEGKAAMIINGPWSYKEYKDAGIDLGIGKLPGITGGTFPAPYTSSKVLMISANVKDKDVLDATIKFIELINEKGEQIKLAKVTGEFPVNNEAMKDPYITDNNDLKALSLQMESGTPMPIVPKMRAIWDGIRPSLEGVMAGKVKPADASKAMQKKAEELVTTMLGSN